MCPLQDALLSKQQARKIPRSIHGDARNVARAVAGTEAFEQSCRDRTRNRRVVAHLRRSLRLGRLRLRGAQNEFTLAATAQNLPVSPSSLPDRRHHSPWRALRKRHLRQCRYVDAEAICERLGKPATAQWFSRPAWHSRSPTYATNCRKQPWTVQPR